MGETILTQHPKEGMTGYRIGKAYYDLTRDAILECLGANGEMKLMDLSLAVYRKLKGQIDYDIPWYMSVVRLDLEARNIIERVSGSGPERVRLVAR